MYSRHHRKVKLLLALADVTIAGLAFAAAYKGRAILPLERAFYLDTPGFALLFGSTVLLWPCAALWLGVYDRLDSARPRVILRDTFQQMLAATIGLILLQYSLRMDLSRPFIGFLAAFAWTGLSLLRLNAVALSGWIRREFGGPHYVLVAGTGERAWRLAESLASASGHGVRLIGFLAEDGAAPAKLNGYPVHTQAELPRLLEAQVIDEVLFAVDSDKLAGLEESMLLCDEIGVKTRVAVDFFPHVNSEIYLDRFGQTPLLTFSAAPHDEIRLFAKRVIDVVLAAAALVILAPLMLVIALLIRITSPGPAIFHQVRCGLNGRRFTFYKFRSMVENAEAMKASLEHLNQKEIAFKIPDDPRATPIGRYLRRFSVDEWPQLWNVLRGDMSIVGPRPAVPGEVERYQRWQRRRLRMRPGLTCLWALEGRDSLDFDTWMRKDMEYIDNWSLALDWKIMLRTIPRVLLGKGAH